jgi:small redox-active disulfide protein 2
MLQDDVKQIRVGDMSVGIIGLKSVMEGMAEEFGAKPDREVMDELMNRLGKRNYIPEKVRGDYEKAFLREFKKFLGKPFEDNAPGGLVIKVLGPGCAQCDRFEQEIMQVLSENRIMADVEHVRDVKEIGKYGVMGTPALIINGEVKSVGRIPTKSQLVEWLADAASQS